MIRVDFDAEHDAVILEFTGDVDAAEAGRAMAEVDKLLPAIKKGFTMLADFSAVVTMEPEVENEIKRGMDLFNAAGVAEVLRVFPDPDMAFGFDALSLFHYSRRVRIQNFRTRQEALARLLDRVKGGTKG